MLARLKNLLTPTPANRVNRTLALELPAVIDKIQSNPSMPETLYILSDLTTPAGAKVRVVELRLPLQMDVITFDDLNVSLTNELTSPSAATDVVVDLARTSYVGSAVLGLLVNLRSRVRRLGGGGGRLVLCNLSPRILEIFRVGSLESLFTITPTREDAIRVLSR
jgi:anti-anti-sigma factor